MKLIRGLVSGSISPNILKREVEVWIQEPKNDKFKNIKSENVLNLRELKERESLIGSSRLVIVEYVKGLSIL